MGAGWWRQAALGGYVEPYFSFDGIAPIAQYFSAVLGSLQADGLSLAHGRYWAGSRFGSADDMCRKRSHGFRDNLVKVRFLSENDHAEPTYCDKLLKRRRSIIRGTRI
jgi:hypothetical protein